MTRLFSLMAVTFAVLVVVGTPLLHAQAPPPQAPAQAEKVFEGELSKVDANAKTLSVKGTGGQEMIFAYTDQTLVVGPEKTVQGLAGKTGATLKVSYREQGGRNMATRIETAPAEKK